MKIYLYLTLGFFFLFGTFTSIAQTCGSGSITLSSQAEVDDFQATYGPCNTMGSNLTISGADITDLTPLAGVTGYVSILRIHSNPMLQSLAGINFTGMDVLSIKDNAALPNFEGLNLSAVGLAVIEIDNNDALTDISGFTGSIFSQITVKNNDQLVNLLGLENADDLSTVQIENNDALESLSGLNVRDVTGSVSIKGNEILSDLQGAERLRLVPDGLFIQNNPSLMSLQGLSGLRIVGTLRITNNPMLTDISAIGGITSGFGQYRIKDNTNLSDCCVIEVLKPLQNFVASFDISNNNMGCNSETEVTTYCEDADGDGFNIIEGDCNDDPMADGALVYPGAVEYCDGLDNDCDELVDVDDPDLVYDNDLIVFCKDATVQLDAMGMVTITSDDVVDYTCTPGGTSVEPSLSANAFNCGNIGENTVTVTVSVIDFPTTTCEATITIEDNVAPDAQCQNVTVDLDAGGSAALIPAQVNNSSSDACGGLTFGLDQTDFNCDDVDSPVTVTLTVSDANSNSNTCTATITVEDNVAPDAQCQNATVQLNAGGSAALIPAQVNNSSSDACGGLTFGLDQTDFNCDDVDSPVTVTLTVTDANSNSNTCTATITVEDNVAPDAQCQNATVQLNAGGSAALIPAQVNNSSSDACGDLTFGLDQTDFNCNDVDSPVTVTLTVSDANSNSNTCTATITVEDNVAPNAQCQNATVQLNAGGSAALTPAQVNNSSSDACGGLTFGLDQTDFNCDDVDSPVTVTLTVSDANSNSNTCTATITVEDNVAPNAQCQNATVQLNAGGSAALTPAQVNNSSSDACGGLTFGLDQTDFNCNDVDSPVTVTLTVSDANSNSNTCTAQVTVEDVTPPVPVCQDQTITFNGESTIAVLFTDLLDAANSTDNCEVLVIAEEEPDVLISCDLAGTSIPVTVHVEDLSGNPASCTSTITVDGLPCGWQDMGGIGCQDDNNTSSYDGVGSYDLLANNCAPEFPYAGDQIAFLSTELCGDGEIIAEVTNVQGTGYAGVMMRDDLSPNAPMISMGTNRVNFVRRQVRILASYPAWPQQILSMDKFWVRIVRNGNQFQAFASADGNAWIPYLNQQVFMNNNCIQVGLFTYSEKPGTPLSASFSNVFVTGQNNLQQQSQNAFAGTNLIQKQDINIFPNPTKDVFYIDFSSYLGQGVEMRLFNGTGQAVHYSKYDEAPGLEQLDVSRLVPGIYNLIITFEEERIVKRVVVGR